MLFSPKFTDRIPRCHFLIVVVLEEIELHLGWKCPGRVQLQPADIVLDDIVEDLVATLRAAEARVRQMPARKHGSIGEPSTVKPSITTLSAMICTGRSCW